ncbi:hypothetical protein HYT25_00450 [Candidatus Pacearchaeota archaeon]|nr:hypothetical protein [Candidatus Pacearchaeota archaeon]
MKITICGSIAFYDEMEKIKSKLEEMGHETELPLGKIRDENGNIISSQEYYVLRQDTSNPNSWLWQRKQEAIIEHFRKIERGDAILITNYYKNGVENYIGGNTLMEMGLALHFNKRIYLLNPVPELSYKEEILAMQPIILGGNLSLIK